VQVSENFVGREIKVLVEGEANEKQLQSANVSSWEHGQIRTESSAGVPPAPGKPGEIKKRNLGRRDAFPTLIARGEADAPDIDGRIYIHGKLPVGEFARVKIVGHTDYDLIAESV
jgi:ribosomal protein S12 methylthiotransferase